MPSNPRTPREWAQKIRSDAMLRQGSAVDTMREAMHQAYLEGIEAGWVCGNAGKLCHHNNRAHPCPYEPEQQELSSAPNGSHKLEKYMLLKDLFECSAGTVFGPLDYGPYPYRHAGGLMYAPFETDHDETEINIPLSYIEKHPEWFALIPNEHS